MGLRGALAALAGGAPVPVFPVEGAGAGAALDALRVDGRVRLVDSPRAANVLLVVGRLPRRLLRPAVRVHDQMSHPRATVWWPLGWPERRLERAFPRVLRIGTEAATDAIVAAHRALLRGEHATEPAVLPDVDPAPWRGEGPYGQGGKGMTGGVPYGRPMASRAPDRDGLELDVLPVRVGPFFPPFPRGLVLEVRLQGDLVQEAKLCDNPFYGVRYGAGAANAPFRRALREPVPVAELERARARHHLRWLAGALRFHGLSALGERTLRLAGDGGLSAAQVRSLGRLLERTRALGWATAGVGVLPAERLAGLGAGPVARAAGLSEDERTAQPAYRALGFEPQVGEGGDARARWRQRLAEAVHALELAERAGERRAEPAGSIESPHGRLTAEGTPVAALLDLLPELLAGQEWGDAMTTVMSLDLDLEAALPTSRVGEAG